MYRLLVILRHTFKEAIVQPIYALLLAVGVLILGIFAMLPFFTLGEDTIMFKSVGLDIILLLVLIATLFATSKSIYEEIEDRTMLTLMSKPVRRWEVLVGKYLGIIVAAMMATAILGVVLILCTYWRIPSDYTLKTLSLNERDVKVLWDTRKMHIYGLVPSLVTIWLQVSVLAAVGVAISTRLSLVVNLPAVILLYVAGNLTRFLFPMSGPGAVLDHSSKLTKGVLYVASLILPYLETFDLRQLTVYRPIRLAGTEFLIDPNGVYLGTIWLCVAAAALYAICYSAFALAAGMWLFQSRELGGAEG